jgi:hypothetical protein
MDQYDGGLGAALYDATAGVTAGSTMARTAMRTVNTRLSSLFIPEALGLQELE